MSNPISKLPNADREPEENDASVEDASLEGDRPELEVDPLDPALPPMLEVDGENEASEDQESDASESGGWSGLIVLVLAGLLLGSVAINLKQSRDIAGLESRSSEYEQALAAAVERIDGEASRADSAEAALDRVDSAVDVVNERVVGLQEALDGLREATVR